MQQLAHFLLINSEAVESSCYDTKISLIYFFLKFAKANDKESYEDFALYLLETFLSEEFQKIQHNTEAPKIGWSLIKFIDNHFFSSDDTEEVLLIIDKIVFRETDRISKTEPNSVDIMYLAWTGMYLKERIELLRVEDEYYWNVKEFLCISFFELANNIRFIKEDDYFSAALCKIVFKSSLDHSYIKHFCCDGVMGLKKVKAFHQINNFNTFYTNPGHLNIYDLHSCYKLLFENQNKIKSTEGGVFIKKIEKFYNFTVKKEKNYDLLIPKLLSYAFFMEQNQESEIEKILFFNLIGKIVALEGYGRVSL